MIFILFSCLSYQTTCARFIQAIDLLCLCSYLISTPIFTKYRWQVISTMYLILSVRFFFDLTDIGWWLKPYNFFLKNVSVFVVDIFLACIGNPRHWIAIALGKYKSSLFVNSSGFITASVSDRWFCLCILVWVGIICRVCF